MKALLLGLCACVAALVLGVALIAFGIWLRLAPPPGHWTLTVASPLGELRVSVPKLLQAATDPSLARWLDGRRLPSPIGALALRWEVATATLTARCAPCVLRVSALGDEPVVLREATLSLRRAGEGRYDGALSSGDVVLPFAASATATSLSLRGQLPATPMAALFALLGDAVPETQRAQIDGTFAARVSLQLPQRRWTIEPAVEGFEVRGLATEALAHAHVPAQCAPVPRGRVSPWLERAVIAAEDQRFAEHAGYDLAELRDAIEGNQRRDHAARGASTITQQLARLVYTGDARSLARKARELLYAVEMERTLGKGRILRLYLAIAPWGDGLCGAESAARLYFDKGAAALDPREAAWLAVRLRAPSASTDAVTSERIAPVLTSLRVPRP